MAGKAASTAVGSIEFFFRFFNGVGLIAEINP
jgi:hypothetical protein